MQPPKKRNVACLALVALAYLSGGLIGAEEPSSEIPLTLPPPQSSPLKGSAELPAWVSARGICPEDGSLTNWDLIPPHYQRYYATVHRNRLNDLEAARSAGNLKKVEELAECPETPTKFFRSTHGRHNDSLKSLTLHAEAIYRGTVRARDSGFIQGLVGSLVLVEIDKTLKAPQDRPSPPRLFFEYPFADFRLGDMLFCLRPDRSPAVPEVGDSVLIFVLFPPTAQGLMIGSRSEEIFFETSAGALSLPKQLSSDPLVQNVETLSGIEERIARLLATSGGQKGGAQ